MKPLRLFLSAIALLCLVPSSGRCAISLAGGSAVTGTSHSASGWGASGTNTAFTVTLPTGVTAGNCTPNCVVIVVIANTTSNTASSYLPVISFGDMQVLCHLWASGDTTSPSFTPVGNAFGWAVLAYAGSQTNSCASAINVVGAGSANSSSTIATSHSVTPTVGSGKLLMVYDVNSNALTFSAPSEGKIEVQGGDWSSGNNIGVADFDLSASSANVATDNQTMTISSANSSNGLQLVIAPQSAGGYTLDTYGGLNQIACPSGAQTHFYTQKIGNRWWVCDPLGHGFFLRMMVGVNYGFANQGGNTAALQTKYTTYQPGGTNPYTTSQNWIYNWSIQQVNRLKTWGFSALEGAVIGSPLDATFAGLWNTADHTIPIQFKMPFTSGASVTYYSMLSSIYVATYAGCSASFPLKDMIQPLYYGGPSNFTAPAKPFCINGGGDAYCGYDYADYFDPHWPACVNSVWDAWLPTTVTSTSNAKYLFMTSIDETDETGFVKQGPDFSTVDTSGTISSISLGGQPAFAALATSPTQSQEVPRGTTVVYSDHEVYTKVQLANDLLNAYLGQPQDHFSIDPAASNFAGNTNMATALAALNTAWAAHYTTLSAADSAHCGTNLANCLQGGTYTGWGTGTGLLDDDGTCPNGSGGHFSPCWDGTSAVNLTGQTAAMKADMSAFYTHYLKNYFSIQTASVHSHAPLALTELDVGDLGGVQASTPRKEVLQVASQYLDILEITLPAFYCPTCNDLQQRLDFIASNWGDRPWIEWEQFYAYPDSAMAVAPNNYPNAPPAVSTTQAGRGAIYQNNMMPALLNAKTTASQSFPVVGLTWWMLYDNSQLNEGFVTPSDNVYDGVNAVISTSTCGPANNGVDIAGYSCGGETANFGDFVDSVTAANAAALATLTTGVVILPASSVKARGKLGFGAW